MSIIECTRLNKHGFQGYEKATFGDKALWFYRIKSERGRAGKNTIQTLGIGDKLIVNSGYEAKDAKGTGQRYWQSMTGTVLSKPKPKGKAKKIIPTAS